MRKYLAIMMCAGLLLTATGCGDNKETETKDEKKTEEKEETKKSKSLNCSYEEEFDDMSMAMRLKFEYDADGKEIKSINGSYEMELPEDEDVSEVIGEDIDSLCDEVKNGEEIASCKATMNGNKVEAKFSYDMDKIDELYEEGEVLFKKDTAIKDLKESLEEENEDSEFVCKIEE